MSYIDQNLRDEGDIILSIYNSFNVIVVLCILNCMFFISQLLRLIFLRKIGRSF